LRANDADEENKYVPAKIAVGSKFGLLRDLRIVKKMPINKPIVFW
jgi:hypothetical protein